MNALKIALVVSFVIVSGCFSNEGTSLDSTNALPTIEVGSAGAAGSSSSAMPPSTTTPPSVTPPNIGGSQGAPPVIQFPNFGAGMAGAAGSGQAGSVGVSGSSAGSSGAAGSAGGAGFAGSTGAGGQMNFLPTVILSLDGKTAAGMNLCAGSEGVKSFTFDIFGVDFVGESPNQLNLPITKVVVHQVANGSLADITNAKLVTVEGEMYGKIDVAANMIVFESTEIVATGYQAWPLELIIDYVSNATDSSEFAFSIDSPADVVFAKPVEFKGSFPIRGNTFTVISNPEFCGQVTNATFCDSWIVGTTDYGYRGCCGAFKSVELPKVGMLIKGSSPSVYYIGNDGLRHLLPTNAEIASWFGKPQQLASGPFVDPFDGTVCNIVRQMDDGSLAQIVLSGNVTLRPGALVTGIATDPKRYAISKGRVLRWLENDKVTDEVYGTSFESRTALRPDAEFVNYLVGSSIMDASTYDATKEFYSADIEDSFSN